MGNVCEDHNYETKDGYVNNIIRIPAAKMPGEKEIGRPVVIY